MKKLLALICILMLSSQASASVYCSGKIKDLHVRRDGSVVIFYFPRGDYIDICNINVDRGGASATTCRGWLSIFESAIARTVDITFYYDADVTCATLPTYGSAPTPYYVMSN
jgi:hypothetical protein